MCQSSCGYLYKEGVPLKDITCPCGLGYWDIFQEKFIDGDQIRNGARTKREYEADIQAKMKEGEFEARLREQWIHHFLACPEKLALDAKAIKEGRGDRSSYDKAQTELKEIARGDYKSRGRSRSVSGHAPVPPPPEGAGSRHQERRHGTTRDLTSVPVGRGPDAMTLPARAGPGGDTRHGTRPDSYSLFPRTAEVVTASHQEEPSSSGRPAEDSRIALRSYFLSAEGIRQDVLEHHIGPRKNTFGPGATVKPYTNPDGRQGYLIRASMQPTKEIVNQLQDDSQTVEETTRHPARHDRRPLVDTGGKGERTTPGVATSQSGSRLTRHSTDDIVQDIHDLEIASDRAARPVPVAISPPPATGRPSRHKAREEPAERETYPPRPVDVADYPPSGEGDVDDEPRGSLRHRPATAHVTGVRRESLSEPQRRHAGGAGGGGETGRQPTTGGPRDGREDRPERHIRRDSGHGSRHRVDRERVDSPPQKRHGPSRS